MLNEITNTDIAIITALASIGGAWFLLRYQVNRVLQNQEKIFERLDKVTLDLYNEKLNDSKLLSRDEAEDKYVKKYEINDIKYSVDKLEEDVRKIMNILLKDK